MESLRISRAGPEEHLWASINDYQAVGTADRETLSITPLPVVFLRWRDENVAEGGLSEEAGVHAVLKRFTAQVDAVLALSVPSREIGCRASRVRQSRRWQRRGQGFCGWVGWRIGKARTWAGRVWWGRRGCEERRAAGTDARVGDGES